MSTFRVLQFNMQFGQIWDDMYPDRAPIRIEATVEEIRRHQADIIFLQELEQTPDGGKHIEPPPNYTRLKAELQGYDSWFAYPMEDARELPFGVGLAIFSKTPLRSTIKRNLPSPPLEFEFFGQKTTPTDRIMIGAETTVQGRNLLLYNTHLLAFFMLGSGSTANPFQRNLVANQLNQSKEPTLLAGDFNVSRHQTLVEQFSKLGYTTVQDKEVTWRRRPFVLDHIFYSKHLRCTAHRVIPTPASDHHALVADFEWAS